MSDSDGVAGGSALPPPPQRPREVDLGLPHVGPAVEIGRGASGVVYRADQPGIDRSVAIKLLPAAGLDDSARQRFERECRAMGALSSHPGIVTVYDAGFASGGEPYIIMELMEGGSLADRLARQGRFRWDEAVEIGIRLANALDAAHRKGVLHRDVKPENVLISTYGEAKLADFSIARVSGANQTQTGLISATPAHAAPEILRGDPPSPQADVYSLGSTLLTLMMGRPAFTRDTDTSIFPVLRRVDQDPVPDLRPLGVPDGVAAVLERAMAKDPAQRQQTAADLARELAAARDAAGQQGFAVGGATQMFAPVVGGGASTLQGAAAAGAPAPPGTAAPPLRPAGGRRMALIGAVAAVVVVAAGGGVYLASRGSSSAPAAQSSPTAPPSASERGATSTGSGTGSASAASGPDLSGALVGTGDLPSGYSASDQGKMPLGDLNPCNVAPKTDGIGTEAQAAFQGGDPGSGDVQLVGVTVAPFSGGGADAYVASVDAAGHSCSSFDQGGVTVTLTHPGGATIGDQTVRLDSAAAPSGVSIHTSYVIVRRGTVVILVAINSSGGAQDALAERIATAQLAKLPR